MVVLHFKMETQGSIRTTIRSEEWTVSIDICDPYLHVPMHKAIRKYLRFVVNKRIYQFTGLPFGLATSTREFTKLLHPVIIETVRCQAARLLGRLADPCRYSRTGPTACPDDHQCTPVSHLDHQLWEVRSNTLSGLPVHRDAVQHSTIHIGAPAENASKSPVCSSTLDDQPRHHSPRSSQIAGHGGVYGNAGSTWKTPPMSSPVVGCHSLMPEDRELVRQDHSSSVCSVRGGLMGISCSSPGSSSRHQINGSDSLHGCIQFRLGSPVRLTLNTGTVVIISKIVAHQHSGDAGRHRRCERLHPSSEVPGGTLDVRQCSDSGLHRERDGVGVVVGGGGWVEGGWGGTNTILYTLMQLTFRLLKWCDRKAITLVPGHLPGVHNIQADSLSRVGQTLNTEWTMTMERLRPVFAQ